MDIEHPDQTNPSTTSLAYQAMASKWSLIESLLGGTDAMRQAGETYLPRHEEETQNGYDRRLQCAVLLNMFERTRDTLSGKPFAESAQYPATIPKIFPDQIFPDIDLQGNNLDVFLRAWFREALAKGMAHVLVDYPIVQPKSGSVRTLETDRQENNRPYWVLIKPERLISAYAETIQGNEVLLEARIKESFIERDGYAEVQKERIRILTPGQVTILEPIKRKGKELWAITDEWQTGLSYIPLVTFYADRVAFMEANPPLLGLAHLNIAHWQSSSDQRHILTVTRFPILACSGAAGEDGAPVIIGPNKVLYNPDPSGRFYYLEHQGAAIQSGWEDLKQLEEQMSQYGAEFLKRRSGDITATARALDSAEASSDLAAMVCGFEDAIRQALTITADWLNIPPDQQKPDNLTVNLTKDFGLDDPQGTDLQILRQSRDKRDISRKTFLEALKQRNILPTEFDAEEDMDALLEETAQFLSLGESTTNLDPAQQQE